MRPLILCVLLLAACDLSPEFVAPTLEAPDQFSEAAEGVWKEATPAAAQEKGQWWRAFEDAGLSRLQERLEADNLDVQAALARVTAARDTADISFAQLLPTLDAQAQATREQPNAVARGLSNNGALNIENRFRTGLVLAYELDLFGANLTAIRAAEAEADAAEAARQNTLLFAQAELADAYFSLRAAAAKRLELDEAVDARLLADRALEARVAIGDLNPSEVATDRIASENLRQQALAVEREERSQLRRIAVLLGKNPSDFELEPDSLPTYVPLVPPGLPSALLERRPDISEAIYTLNAANERIGAARSAFFPSISLTASGGYEDNKMRDVFRWSNRSWAVGPLVNVPLFSGGSSFANLSRSKARYAEQVALYRKTVLNAFAETEDALTAQRTLAEAFEAQTRATNVAENAFHEVAARFRAGDQNIVTYAQARELIATSRNQLVDVQRDRLLAATLLVRALGGGWSNSALNEAQPEQVAAQQ